ncbi:hypothetical protein Avbf_14704, partial [Armadillidium vulgare]
MDLPYLSYFNYFNGLLNLLSCLLLYAISEYKLIFSCVLFNVTIHSWVICWKYGFRPKLLNLLCFSRQVNSIIEVFNMDLILYLSNVNYFNGLLNCLSYLLYYVINEYELILGCVFFTVTMYSLMMFWHFEVRRKLLSLLCFSRDVNSIIELLIAGVSCNNKFDELQRQHDVLMFLRPR